MRNTKRVALSLFTLAMIIFLGSCKKDDPEPKAPDGPSLTTDYGSIKGTVSGQLTDGTAFAEDFNFNLSPAKGILETEASGDQFLEMDLYGSMAYNSIRFSLKYDKKKVVSLDVASNLYFDLFKEMKNNTALKVSVETIEDAVDILWPLKPKLNDATYHFVFESGPYGISYDTDAGGDWLFKTEDGSSVAFDKFYGDFQYIKRPDGKTQYSSSLYDDLHLELDDLYRVYFTDDQGTNLSLKETIPGDHLAVSNFSFDEGTGSMKFDFVLQVSGKARYIRNNSTQHIMTVTGKADLLVYNNVLSRTRD